ncbi:MAG: hypothetical protein KAY37_16275 [Phycisphaerae bacterium]|nr:hypothetical protein [Phycisphaerae bacterium]
MTRREKIIALCVGGTLGGLGLVWAARNVVVDPFLEVREQIAVEQTKRVKLKKQESNLERVKKDWAELTARTLAADPEEAQRRFRTNIHELLERHGLVNDPKTKDSKVSPGAISLDKNGFYKVPVNVNTTGTLKQIVGFLCDFYRQPYIARLDKVTIGADKSVISDANSPRRSSTNDKRTRSRTSRRSSRRRRTSAPIGPDGPVLTVSITATTLVLPKVSDIKPRPIEELVELETGSLLHELAAFNEISEKNLFKPYQPPPSPPPVAVAPVKTPEVKQTEPVKEPSPPVVKVDPRAGAGQLYVRMTSLLNGQPVTYVFDENRLVDPPKQFFHDDEIDDGVLLLIHPRGLVVRVTAENGRQTDYFYCLGDSFADREELSPELHPEVWLAIQDEFPSPDSPEQPLRDS